jgi:hypothetical protein
MKKINKILKNVISAGLKKHGINFEWTLKNKLA